MTVPKLWEYTERYKKSLLPEAAQKLQSALPKLCPVIRDEVEKMFTIDEGRTVRNPLFYVWRVEVSRDLLRRLQQYINNNNLVTYSCSGLVKHGNTYHAYTPQFSIKEYVLKGYPDRYYIDNGGKGQIIGERGKAEYEDKLKRGLSKEDVFLFSVLYYPQDLLAVEVRPYGDGGGNLALSAPQINLGPHPFRV